MREDPPCQGYAPFVPTTTVLKIDSALTAGKVMRGISRDFAVSEDALSRHRAHFEERIEKKVIMQILRMMMLTGKCDPNILRAIKLLTKIRGWDIEGRELIRTKAVERRARLRRQQSHAVRVGTAGR